jgi:exonuclease SbcC
MKPLHLRLRGAIGIRDGLGLDEIEIPFSCFSPGLVTLVGKNGSGKSTLLDNMHPYLELPSRKGSLADHFFLRDSFREFVFELAGKQYRSSILIDARTGKIESYIYENSAPLNDGRVSTYKKEVERLFGSPQVFFNSVFVAQGSSGVTALSAAKRKELFIELLGLNVYDRYVQYSKHHGDELEKSIAAKLAVLEQLEKDLVQKSDTEETINRIEQALLALRAEITLEESRRDNIEAELRGAQERAAARIQLKRQRESLEEEITAMAHECAVAETDHLKERSLLETKATELTKAITFSTKILSRKSEIDAHLAELRSLRENDQTLCASERALSALEHAEAQARLEHERLWAAYYRSEALIRQEEDRALADERRLELLRQTERETVRQQLQTAQASASLIDETPCRPYDGLVERCKLLTNAVEAQKQVPALLSRLRVLEHSNGKEDPEQAVLRSVLEQIARKKSDLEGSKPQEFTQEHFTARKKAISYDEKQHKEIQERISGLERQKWEHLREQLSVAQSVVAEKQHALADVTERLRATEARYISLAEKLERQLKSKRDELRGLSELGQEETEELRLRSEREEVGSKLESLRKRELNLHGQLAAAESVLERLKRKLIEQQEAQVELLNLKTELEHWQLLQRACSKDGIPALELDAAGPGISSVANELLASTFGARFQIAFETTRISKDRKKQLETFNIAVYGEDGEKRIEDLSGGERVWIERAISEAIAIYMSNRSGNALLTTFQDESDGALDPENRWNYFALLRESFRIGRRHFTFVITQSPDVWSEIEQRIHLEPGVGINLVY